MSLVFFEALFIRRVSQLLFPHLNLSKKNKKSEQTWETVSCYISLWKCCKHLEIPHFSTVFHSFPIKCYVANRTIKTMLETVALQKKNKNKKHFKHQSSFCLPRFLPLSSNLLGIKPKWVKMPRCHGTEKWIVLQSINEKQGIKCWVTKKKKNEGHLCSGRQQHNRDDPISMARVYMLHQFPCPLTRGSVGNWLYNKDFPFGSCVSMKMKQSSNPRWCRYTQQVR